MFQVSEMQRRAFVLAEKFANILRELNNLKITGLSNNYR